MSTARKTHSGGGWPAIFYSLRKSLEVGPWRMWKKLNSRNACKTCAVGMGGQKGGMVNEAGHWPEVCKKSLQAQAADMKGAILPEFFDNNPIEKLLTLTPKQSEDAGRLTFPVCLDATAPVFKPVNWEAAIDEIAAALKNTDPGRVAFYSSGRSSNEAAFLMQSFARVYGTNHVMNCSFYCHQASSVALSKAYGEGTATVTLDDVEHADLVVMLGSNAASNHPRLMTQLVNLKARGGQVIIVNPVFETALDTFHVPSQLKSLFFGTKISSLYIQPSAGGDVALLVGVLKALDESTRLNMQFLAEHAENYQEVIDQTRQCSWADIVENSGVSRDEIDQMANMIAAAKNTIFCWAMGLTHHASGVDNVLAVCNVATATGNVGRPGAGLIPLRGHSNVQGVGSVGVKPDLKDGVRLALEKAYGVPVPAQPGYDTLAMMDAAEQGKIDVLICLGGNLWGSNPDSRWASRAMQNIALVAYLSTKLNPGHFHGRGKKTYILPVLARDEEPQSTTQESMFNFVRLSEGGNANVSGAMRAESSILCDIAVRVLGKQPFDWSRMRSHDEIRRMISDVVPGWTDIRDIGSTRKEFTVAGRILHKPVFNTPSRKARMTWTPLPQFEQGLRLITLRSEGQFNTVVYEESDFYRGMPHRHCIMISEQDAARLRIKDGQRVKVKGEAASLDNIEVVFGRIKPGTVAMFYPEGNELIKPRADKQSGTPSFKSAPVTIEP